MKNTMLFGTGLDADDLQNMHIIDIENLKKEKPSKVELNMIDEAYALNDAHSVIAKRSEDIFSLEYDTLLNEVMS